MQFFSNYTCLGHCQITGSGSKRYAQFRILKLRSRGDADLNIPLYKMKGNGVFVEKSYLATSIFPTKYPDCALTGMYT